MDGATFCACAPELKEHHNETAHSSKANAHANVALFWPLSTDDPWHPIYYRTNRPGAFVVSVGDIKGRALLANWEVKLVPLFLSVAVSVSLEGSFIHEFHRDDVSLLHFGFFDVLDFERFRPNTGDTLVLARQFLR